MSKEVVEALKETLRTFILGMIPVTIGVLAVIKSGIDVVVGGFSIKWILVFSIFVSGAIGAAQTAIMSGADKWIHEKKIETPLDLKSMDSLRK